MGGAGLAVVALVVTAMVDAGQIRLANPGILAWLALAGGAALTAGLVYAAVRQIRARRFLPPERYRGPSLVILVALVLIVATLLQAPFGADATALVFGQGELTLLGAVVILTSTQVALLLVTWLFVLLPNALAGGPRLPGPMPWRAIGSGLRWGVAAWLGATLISALVVLLLEAIGQPVQPETAERAIELVEPWLVVFALVILAPIAEELFFRGVVFNAWLRERGPRVAFIGSAALFSIIHLSIVSLVPIFLLGLALAWIYRRTNNLLAPIAMHATVNGISVAFALLARFEVIRLPA